MATRGAQTREIDPLKLRRYIDSRGWTITQFAKETGLSQPFTWQVFEGHAQPGRKFLLALIALGVDIGSLLRDEAGETDTAAL